MLACTVQRIDLTNTSLRQDALVNFMLSGGFSPSAKVATIEAPSLVLWGRQDGILDGTEFAPKVRIQMFDCGWKWLENAPHTALHP